MAEGVGFEPTVGCPTLDFESSALNRTQPPFPVRVIVDLSWPRAIIRQSAEFAKVKHHASFAYELENRAPWFKPRDGVAVIITLTGAGIETRIIHEVNYAICNFESFELLEDESARAILRQIDQSYANVAVRYGLPFQLGTLTWRPRNRSAQHRSFGKRASKLSLAGGFSSGEKSF